ASELALYLRHMASDFRAIDDLASWSSSSAQTDSPAHFSTRERGNELRGNIDFLSYVTLGNRPFRFNPNEAAPPWDLLKPWTYPEVVKHWGLSKHTDVAYRTCYRACAGGQFREPPLADAPEVRWWRGMPQHKIELWDNDGIVNTLSMFWGKGKNVIVPADHMDIVGHYTSVAAEPGSGREFQSYDLLESGSGFGKEVFQNVWRQIF